jgi:outer membrane protein assembly factor BamE (lipoprotein component of BamABCDE complex)
MGINPCAKLKSRNRRRTMRSRTLFMIFLGTILISGCGLKEDRVQMINTQYPQWDQTTIEKVAARQVETGMNEEMVLAALGQPYSVTQDGDEERWSYAEYVEYGDGGVKRKPVYFVFLRNGKVVRTAGDWDRLGYWIY